MKKFILFFMSILLTVSINAQQYNYASSSQFTDNWSATIQVGTLTTLNDFYTGHTAVAPITVIGVDKFVTPWLGFGADARTLIGTGNGKFNTHTAFDAVNVNGYGKINIANLFEYYGTRRVFEPIIYTGLGWGHQTAHPHYDYMTYRAGAELNFNIGSNRSWAVVVNPSVVWGDINNGKLMKSHGNFEVTAGVVYHFKSKNGSNSFNLAKLYDQDEVDRLNAEINRLKNRPIKTIEKVIEKPVIKQIPSPQNKWVVAFTYDSYELTDLAKQQLNTIKSGSTVVIDAYASKEPKSNEEYNVNLSNNRANSVKNYLESHGVKVIETKAHGCDDSFGRVAVITIK